MSDKPENIRDDEHLDNVTPIFQDQEQPKKNPLKKQWIIFFCILAVILILLILFLFFCTNVMDGVKRFFRYNGIDEDSYSDIRFDSYGNCSYAISDHSFAIASQDGVNLYAENGKTLQKVTGNFSNPVLDASKDMFLLSDVGGKRLFLMDNEGKMLFDLETEGLIYDADLSKSGCCAVLYEGTDCHAILDVYTREGSLLYSYHSESAFLNSCALSPDGSLAVVSTLGQEDIGFHAAGRILTTRQEGVRAEISFGGQVIFDSAFLSNDTICAVGENSLFFFDTQGNLIKEYQEENAGLISYTFSGNHLYAAYDLFETGTGYRICSISENGELVCSIDVSAMPIDIRTSGSYLSVLDSDKLTIYDLELTPCNETANNGYVASLVRGDGTALCIGSGTAELYIP